MQSMQLSGGEIEMAVVIKGVQGTPLCLQGENSNSWGSVSSDWAATSDYRDGRSLTLLLTNDWYSLSTPKQIL